MSKNLKARLAQRNACGAFAVDDMGNPGTIKYYIARVNPLKIIIRTDNKQC